MSFLLDTHALLWFLTDDARLSAAANEAICSNRRVAVSCVSLWEIAIKKSLGKLRVNPSASEIANICTSKGIEILGILPSALDRLVELPPVHRDPFDRLLIATALEEGMTLITKDSIIPKYDVPTLW